MKDARLTFSPHPRAGVSEAAAIQAFSLVCLKFDWGIREGFNLLSYSVLHFSVNITSKRNKLWQFFVMWTGVH